MIDWTSVAQTIATATGKAFTVENAAYVSGGCIDVATVVVGQGQRYFVKHNRVARLPLYETEAEGLRALAHAHALKVPSPIAMGADRNSAFLVLEYLELRPLNGATEERLGQALACQHRITQSGYGWHRNNAIGMTPQINTPATDWIEFWRDRRLGYQLDLAIANGHAPRLEAPGRRLLERLSDFFAGYAPPASLLHGDLWSGNAAATSTGEPAVFDPAVYFGDREADLAMTELFGGFSPRFYAAYRDTWPLDAGYGVRKDLYNLYHLLNHLNLFEGAYLARAENLMQRLLIEIEH